jgi:hypothetical protein
MPEVILVLVAGAVGGLVSTLVSEGGFMLPTIFTDTWGRQRWHPGTAGDAVVGAVAGMVFWALYTPDPSFSSPATVGPVLGSIVAGLVVGLSTRSRHIWPATKVQCEYDTHREPPDEMLDSIHEMRAAPRPRKPYEAAARLDETSKATPGQ